MTAASYRNPWHKPGQPEYGPAVYTTDAKPVPGGAREAAEMYESFPTCPVCDMPAHASESDDLDRHPECAALARPPCGCGEPDAEWRGPEDGVRVYSCTRCRARQP